MPNQEIREPTIKNVAIVAPVWRQNVLSLWLQMVGKIEVVTCTTTFSSFNASLVPDLLIFCAQREQIEGQIQTIKQLWPTTRLLVVVEDTKQQSEKEKVSKEQAMAADVTWLNEPSAKQLLNVIDDLLRAELS